MLSPFEVCFYLSLCITRQTYMALHLRPSAFLKWSNNKCASHVCIHEYFDKKKKYYVSTLVLLSDYNKARVN